MGTIGEEIRQTKPFADVAEEAVVTLVATTNRVRDALSGPVDARGLTLQQYNVLRILRGAGASGLPTLDIASRMLEKSPGITRLLDRLEAKQLVLRERGSDDRRCVYCTITASGLELLAALDRPVRQVALTALSGLGETKLRRLLATLDEVRGTLRTAAGR